MATTLGQYLEQFYTKPGHPAFFLGIEKLYKHLKQKGFNPTKSFLKGWLSENDAYTLHKDARRRFRTVKVITSGPNYLYDADLAQMDDLADSNDGIRFLLVVIDAFSKKAAVRPLKNKTATEVSLALRQVFEEIGKPVILRHDPGTDFVNSKVKKLLKEYDVKDQTTTNEKKAHFAERFIRTLKSLLYRHITNTNSFRYLDVLTDIVDGYNNTIHSTTGIKPTKVKGKAAKKLFWKMFRPKNVSKIKPYGLRVGDSVRISYLTKPFDRAFDQHWTGEIFFVTKRFRRQGIPLYKLKDFNGEEITGSFYAEELQKITFDPQKAWKVEKVLKTRKRKGKTESLVRWLHFPPKFDSWVQDLESL